MLLSGGPMIGCCWMIGRPTESTPRPAERPADAPVQGVARSHGKPAASGRISAPSDGREWMSHSGRGPPPRPRMPAIWLMSWRGSSPTSEIPTPIRSSTNPNAVPHLPPGARGPVRCLPRPCKPATWGRAGAGTPPSRGGVAAFGPAGSALWGGATTPARCPVRSNARAGLLR